MPFQTAAIVTVGSELVEGLRLDTNTAEIARRLAPRGLRVIEAVSIGDDVAVLSATLRRLCAQYRLVVVTGGLGPTHDDITREAASHALAVGLHRDPALVELLEPSMMARHRDPAAIELVLGQADVLDGADVILPTTGTAPGQVVGTPAGEMALLPGPPSEMRGMLATVVDRFPLVRGLPRELGVVGLPESAAQLLVQEALSEHASVGLTVLARPGDVRVLLLDEGAGAEGLGAAADAVALRLAEHCYSSAGGTLAEAVLDLCRRTGIRLATAESCTGGMVGAELTATPGSSDVYLGGVVAYSDATKRALLGVNDRTLSMHGAVSAEVAAEMAAGARARLDADLAVSITGIAGPDGGSAAKPVGLVWFGVDFGPECGISTTRALFSGSSREAVRMRATSTALDLVRKAVLGRST